MNIKLLSSTLYWKNFILLTGVILLLACSFLYISRGKKGHLPSVMATSGTTQNGELYDEWKTFPGASRAENGGVIFNVLDRKIVNQDGSGGQANPAVNVGGSHLATSGDFTLSVDMANLGKVEATFRLYGEVPIIYDEWRHEGTSISITMQNGQLTIRQWAGRGENPIVTKEYEIEISEDAVLSIERVGEKVSIGIDGTRLTTLPSLSLFRSSKLWFGAEASENEWILNKLSINGNAKFEASLDSRKIVNRDSLSALAGGKRTSFRIGAAVSLYPLMTNQKYRDLALNEFSMWTAENEMKAQFLHPSKDEYVFSDADLLVDTAVANNITVHGHALVFGEANPAWIQNTPRAQLKGVMTDHITAVMQHFKGRVSEWDVINEPLDDGAGGLRRSIWYEAMGEDYISTALRAARAADPTAKLYINEYGLEEDGDRWQTMLALIKRLQADGVPLDGIGFQSHIYKSSDEVDGKILAMHIAALAELGLSSRISEIDVHGDNQTRQAEQYSQVLEACTVQPSCTSFSTWGISDAFGSTTSDHTYPLEYGDDVLWDSTFKPKKAYHSLIDYLK